MIFQQMAIIHGFFTQTIDHIDEWMLSQISSGRIVAQWSDEECIIYAQEKCIGAEFRELLEKSGSGYKIKGHITLPRIFGLFLEGIIDFLACSNEIIEFPQLSHELMQLIHLANQKPNENISSRISGDPLKLAEINKTPYLTNLWGKLMSVEKKYSEAGAFFRNAIEANRQFGEPYGNLGTLLWSMGKQREGFLMITEALLKNPYSVSAQLNFFDAGYEMREFAGMSRVIESILPLVTDYPEFRHHLAICYQKMGKETEAMGVLKGILDEFPGDEDAKKLLDTIQTHS